MKPRLFFILLAVLTGGRGHGAEPVQSNSPPAPAQYELRKDHDPDGIGKFYMGREIAHVMGHQAADWLERRERETEERPDLVVDALHLKKNDVVADIGAGTGYYTRRIAKIASGGRVLAVDIQPEMLELLTNRLARENIRNVQPVLGEEQDAHLPTNSVDLALLVDVYHEFDYPYEMMAALCRGMKAGGRVVFVEFRGEDPAVPIKPLHKMTVAQLKKEMAPHPLEFVEVIEKLPIQHVVIFRKVGRSPPH